MRKLVLKMSISIDGFVGRPDGSVIDLIEEMSEEATAWDVANIFEPGAHLMGRKTFDDMAAYWPVSDEPFAEPMNRIPKIVFSRSGKLGTQGTGALTSAEAWRDGKGLGKVRPDPETVESWAHPTIITGDLVEELRKLKRGDGAIPLAHGGAGFARSLIASGELDEIRLLVHPVALGQGLPIFNDIPAVARFDLVEHQAFPGGAAAHVYRPTSA